MDNDEDPFKDLVSDFLQKTNNSSFDSKSTAITDPPPVQEPTHKSEKTKETKKQQPTNQRDKTTKTETTKAERHNQVVVLNDEDPELLRNVFVSLLGSTDHLNNKNPSSRSQTRFFNSLEPWEQKLFKCLETGKLKVHAQINDIEKIENIDRKIEDLKSERQCVLEKISRDNRLDQIAQKLKTEFIKSNDDLYRKHIAKKATKLMSSNTLSKKETSFLLKTMSEMWKNTIPISEAAAMVTKLYDKKMHSSGKKKALDFSKYQSSSPYIGNDKKYKKSIFSPFHRERDEKQEKVPENDGIDFFESLLGSTNHSNKQNPLKDINLKTQKGRHKNKNIKCKAKVTKTVEQSGKENPEISDSFEMNAINEKERLDQNEDIINDGNDDAEEDDYDKQPYSYEEEVSSSSTSVEQKDVFGEDQEYDREIELDEFDESEEIVNLSSSTESENQSDPEEFEYREDELKRNSEHTYKMDTKIQNDEKRRFKVNISGLQSILKHSIDKKCKIQTNDSHMVNDGEIENTSNVKTSRRKINIRELQRVLNKDLDTFYASRSCGISKSYVDDKVCEVCGVTFETLEKEVCCQDCNN